MIESYIDGSLDAQITGLDVAINKSGVASTSRGLVGDTIFAILPNVKPIHTFVITVAFQFVSSWFYHYSFCRPNHAD